MQTFQAQAGMAPGAGAPSQPTIDEEVPELVGDFEKAATTPAASS